MQMIEGMFKVFLLIATCSFFAAFTTPKKNLRMFLLVSAFLLLGTLGYAALNIEQTYCWYNLIEDGGGCSSHIIQDWGIAWICWGYTLVAFLGLVVTSIQAYDPADGTLL